MRSYWAYKTIYVAAALGDLETVMSDEKPFCVMIIHGLKSTQARVESLLYTETEGWGETSQLNIGKMRFSRCATVMCGLSLRNILTPSIQLIYGAVIRNRFIPHWGI